MYVFHIDTLEPPVDHRALVYEVDSFVVPPWMHIRFATSRGYPLWLRLIWVRLAHLSNRFGLCGLQE